MNMELRRRVRLKSLKSWLTSSSIDPNPSESRTQTFMISSFSFLRIKGFPHTQIPFVLGLVVGPTANPVFCLSKIVFKRYDLPVRYTPATEITAILPSID